MAQMRKQFRMGGREILTPKGFCDHFSPEDFLRNREMAAGFARRQLSPLSPWHNYHGELLFKAVFCWGDLYDRGVKEAGEDWENRLYASDFHCRLLRKDWNTGKTEVLEARELVTGPDFYGNIPGVWSNVKASWLSPEISALKRVMESSCPETLKTLWALSRETMLEERDMQKLFLILSAGYFLAGKTPEALPISPMEARRAYLREETAEICRPIETEDGLLFPAGDIPYEFTRSALTSTSSIHTITPKRLMAIPSSQGATRKPAILRLDGEETRLLPGEYCYASFIKGEMIRIYPTRKENGSVSMERKGDTILLWQDGELLETIDCKDRWILDFAADAQGNYILLEEHRVDYSHFPGANLLPTANLVEVEIRGSQVIGLSHKGRVTKNGRLYPANYPVTLGYLED